MPFADELGPVVLAPHRDSWTGEYGELAMSLRSLELAERGAFDHVGSTSIAGLVAKDVIDIQIRLSDIDTDAVVDRLVGLGYRRRPEPWNNEEASRRGPEMKLVFAPPSGARACNVHVRREGSQGARDALLFRDFLRANDAERDDWGAIKQSIVNRFEAADLATYGQAKQSAWHSLMQRADGWALGENWAPDPLIEWSRT